MISPARLLSLLCGCAVLVSPLVTTPSVEAAPRAAMGGRAAATPDWLDRVNAIRAGSGLTAVSENSAWTDGILAHLIYLEKTPDSLQTGQYANAHTENPASEFYTKEGAREAGRSNLAYSSKDAVDAIDAWLAAPFHAIGMLRTQLTQVGFGRNPRTGYAGLDVIGGLDYSVPAATGPVLFPGDGSSIDLNRFGGESPDPIDTCRRDHPRVSWDNAALPIIALLPESPKKSISATFTGANGITATSSGDDLCVITSDNFDQESDPVYGPTGASILEGDNAVLVVARKPFAKGTQRVTLSQQGRPDIAWSFSYGKGGEPPVDPDPGPQPGTTPGAPGIVSTVTGPRGGKLSVKLTWIAPSDPGSSPITSYVVVAEKLRRGVVVDRGEFTDLKPTKLSINMAFPSTGPWRFQVIAVNETGRGATSTYSPATRAR